MRRARIGLLRALDPSVVEVAHASAPGRPRAAVPTSPRKQRRLRAAHRTTGVAAGAARHSCAARLRPCAASAAGVRGLGPSAGEFIRGRRRGAGGAEARAPGQMKVGELFAQKVAERPRRLGRRRRRSIAGAVEKGSRRAVKRSAASTKGAKPGAAPRGPAGPARRGCNQQRRECLPLPPQVVFHVPLSMMHCKRRRFARRVALRHCRKLRRNTLF